MDGGNPSPEHSDSASDVEICTGGRQKSCVRQYFEESSERRNNRPVWSRCCFCKETVSCSRVDYLRQHLLLKCSKCTPEVREALRQQQASSFVAGQANLGGRASRRSDQSGASTSRPTTSRGVSGPPAAKKLKQATLAPLQSPSTPQAFADQFDAALCRWLVVNGLPFHAVNCPHLLEWVQMLRPSYIPAGVGTACKPVIAMVWLMLLAAYFWFGHAFRIQQAA